MILTLIGSWTVATMGAWFIANYAFKLGLIDIPVKRSSHKIPIPRGAGIGIWAAFVLSAISFKIPLSLWISGALIGLISFFNDRIDITPKFRLILQFLLAYLFITTNSLEYISIFIIFYSIFIVGTANFYNFMDGINGIAGITGITSFFLLSLFAITINSEKHIIYFIISIAIACLGFLPFNIPKAKVFMGDVGSILIGFVFASMVFYLASDFASFLTLSSLLFPFYADTLTTLFIRWKDGESLSISHRRHLYQLFANELNYPHWLISSFYGLFQLIIGVLMIYLWYYNLINQQIFVMFLFTILFIYITIRTRKHVKQNKALLQDRC